MEVSVSIHPRVAAAPAMAAFAMSLVCAAAIASPADGRAGQDARVAIAPRPAPRQNSRLDALRLDVRMVLIPVTVTDPFGAPRSGLPRNVFRLFEDGIEQQIKYFGCEDAPVSVGIVFDASRSMDHKLDQSRAAVAQFFRAALPGDEFFAIEFSEAPRIVSRFTADTEQIERPLSAIRPRTWTALLDAIYLGIHEMKRARNSRKALLILSDGADNNSRYTESEMKSLVREADVCIYAIGLAGASGSRHVRMLRELSEETGGHLCHVRKVADLPAAAAEISAAIRNQYVLGYTPSNRSSDGLYRRIEVRLNQPPGLPPLRASWREGYYAPAGR